MKRPNSRWRPKLVSDDIERDLTPKQLAKIGAISFAYNKAEDTLTNLFSAATDLAGQMLLEVITRIGGIDGRVGIILEGTRQLGLSDELQRAIEDTLGDNGFQGLKKYREAVIHARLISSPNALGMTVERRAKKNEVLLSQDALDALYDHLLAITEEMRSAFLVVLSQRMTIRANDNPELKKGLAAVKFPDGVAQYQESRKKRQTLRPIPEFPPESEAGEAANQWIGARLAAIWASDPAFSEIPLPPPPYVSVEQTLVELLPTAIQVGERKRKSQALSDASMSDDKRDT